MPKMSMGMNTSGEATAAAVAVGGSYENNYSIQFDGIDDFVNLGGPDFSGHTVGTIALWAYVITHPSGKYSLITYQSTTSNYMRLIIGTANKWGLHRRRNDGTEHYYAYSNSASTEGVWEHIAVTQDGTDTKLYIGGVLQDDDLGGDAEDEWFSAIGASQTLASQSPSTDFQGLTMGVTQGGSYFKGFLDEVAIWNVALTAADITAIYKSGEPNDLKDSASYNTDRTGNLKGYWRMEEGTGLTINDTSTNSNHGTLTAFDTDDDGVTTAEKTAFSSTVPS